MDRSGWRLETKLIRAGEPVERIRGAVSLPVFQSATYVFGGAAGYHDVGYARLNNTPNHDALHAKLAAVENAEAALVTASGMAAITTTLLTVLRPGDHLLAQDCLYGATYDFIVRDLPELGVTSELIDGTDSSAWAAKLRPNTRAIYFETISNPLIQLPDLAAGVAFARRHGLTSLIDNTFASPVNFRPAEHGFDLSLHSCTKYMNGHHDLVAGAVIGPAALIERVRHRLNHLGGTLDPHACYLLHRGMKTLALRVRQQNASALALAGWLARHPAVSRVHYPGLASHAQHRRAADLLDGYGGMLSLELAGGTAAAERLVERTRLFVHAPSLGGVDSLIVRPAKTSHASLTPEERRRLGVSDGLVRVSVGIEAVEDLMEDLEQALNLGDTHPARSSIPAVQRGEAG